MVITIGSSYERDLKKQRREEEGRVQNEELQLSHNISEVHARLS